jgi:hypothetical protein
MAGLSGNPRLELLFLLQPAGHGFRLMAVLVLADANSIDHFAARLHWTGHERWIALSDEPFGQCISVPTVLISCHLDCKARAARFAGRRGRRMCFSRRCLEWLGRRRSGGRRDSFRDLGRTSVHRTRSGGRLQGLSRCIVFLQSVVIRQLIGRRGRFSRRGLGGRRRRLRRRRGAWIRRNGCAGRFGSSRTIGANAASEHDAEQKNHDRDDRGRHEQEHQLFSVQLNLAEAVVGGHAFFSSPVNCLSRCNISIGSGNTIVEFFSDAISVRVCR